MSTLIFPSRSLRAQRSDAGQAQQQERGRFGKKHKIITFQFPEKCGILKNAGKAGTLNVRRVLVAACSGKGTVGIVGN